MLASQICAVVSGKGGVGKSTFAFYLANALAGKDTKSVIIDMNIGLRGLDIFFNFENSILYDLSDVVTGRSIGYNDALMVSKYNKNLFGIAAPSDPFFKLSFDDIYSLVSELKKDFEYVILDAPPSICTGFVSSVSICDRAIIVTTPDPFSLSAATKTSLYIKNADVKKSHIVINGVNFYDRRPPVINDFDYIIDTVGVPLLGVIPYEESLMDSIVKNRMVSKRLGFTKSIFNIAKRYNGEDVPLKFG